MMPSGRFLTRVPSNPTNGITIKTRNGSTSQIWFFDQRSKTIKLREVASYSLSKANNGRKTALTIQGGPGYWW
jgi:hypothetical protein